MKYSQEVLSAFSYTMLCSILEECSPGDSTMGKCWGIENRQIAHNRYQGNLAGFGISYGYQWIISPQWNLEAGISLGYAHLNYKRYGQSEGAALLEKSSCNYWGPTQAGISIIYFIR